MAFPAGRSAAGALVALFVPFVLAACGLVSPPSADPTATSDAFFPPPAPGRAQVVGCMSIQPAECASVTRAVLAVLPGALGEPFSIQVRLFGCRDRVAVCPPSLAVRNGQVLVEYPDGGEVRLFNLAGPAGAPTLEPRDDMVVTGPIHPGSSPVEDSGPFEFEVGHCGLTHVVDFNGAFWVLVGDVDGEHEAIYGSERGAIRLQNLDRAQYLGSQNVVFQLARFPGAKRFQLCD